MELLKRNPNQYFFVVVLLFAIANSFGQTASDSVPDMSEYELSAGIKQELTSSSSKYSGINSLKRFYLEIGHKSVWVINFKLTQQADQMLGLLDSAMYFGLDTSWYFVKKLHKLKDSIDNEKFALVSKSMIKFEVWLTSVSLLFVNHLQYGVLEPDNPVYGTRTKQEDFARKTILKALNSKNFRRSILTSQPKWQDYKRLRVAMFNFLTDNFIDFDTLQLPDYKTDSVNCMVKAAEILNQYGYLEIGSEMSYDTYLCKSIADFKKIHGMASDCKIDSFASVALKQNNYRRWQQIALNMERTKWESYLPDNYAMINIPGFKLKVFENDTLARFHRVIIGKPKTPTPLLNSTIGRVIANPYWTAPYSIAAKEMLPRIQKDTNFFKRTNIQVLNSERQNVDPKLIDWKKLSASNFPYTLRQKPGKYNSLGTIKFDFKNPYGVYLHDTDEPELFDKGVRCFSHGCIRLNFPQSFAEYLFMRENKTKEIEKFQDDMLEGDHASFSMSKPIPILIRYYTCEGLPDGSIVFFRDIYQKDEVLLAKMFPKRTVKTEKTK